MTEPTEGIPFRRRADLVVVPASRGTDHAWTVKDPLTLRYYQLRAEEFAILELLDGRRSIADLLRGLHQKFPGHRLSAQNVAAFVGQLLKSELLTATSFGFGRQLADSYTRSQRHAAWRRLGSLLSIRFRGVDPTRFLSAIQPATRVLFSRPALVAMLLLIASAAVVGLSRLDTILQRLPSLSGLTHPANLPVILATFVVIKVLHELGHAAVCRHLGGECHEVGFILVAFMPLLYCDVTDSWMNSSRVQRIAVSLAGILVELVLASLCLFLWLRAAPGPESALLLNVVLICSVSTLLFNGNPLLRYDGYYVLSDWLGIPNLSSESRRELWALFDSAVDRSADAHRDRGCANARSCARRTLGSLARRSWPGGALGSAGNSLVLAAAVPCQGAVRAAASQSDGRLCECQGTGAACSPGRDTGQCR